MPEFTRTHALRRATKTIGRLKFDARGADPDEVGESADEHRTRSDAIARRLIELAPQIVMVVDALGRITWIDGALEALTGYRPDELLGDDILGHFDLEWNPVALDSIGAAFARSGLQRPMLYRVIRKDGSAFIAEVTANSQLEDPVVDGLAVFIRRWDERHLLDQVIESLASGAGLDDTLQLLTQVMGAETLDATGAVLLDAETGRFTRSIAHPGLPVELAEDAGGPGTPWDRAREAGAPVWVAVDELPAPIRAVARSAGFGWCWAWPVLGPSGVQGCLVLWRRTDEEPDHTCTYLLENLVRVTGLVLERQRAAELLRHAAAHDPLTGLANRAQFMERLEDALSADSGPLVGVLYVDLDDFKPVNDRLGHGAGDQVLREVARRLQAVVRGGDLVARLGGDEFTVICPGVTDPGLLQTIARRLTAVVREPILVGDEEIAISASVGLAVAPPGDCSIDVLLDAADAALYSVKETARGGWQVADLPVR